MITDLAVWRPHPESKELQVASLHPGVTREAVQESVGWKVSFAGDMTETPPPSAEELSVLRDLQARTKAAHSRGSQE